MRLNTGSCFRLGAMRALTLTFRAYRASVSVPNTDTGGLSMKLSELIPHTAAWTGVSDTHVNTVARVLRPAGLVSSQGRGPGGALMTTSDKINLCLLYTSDAADE